jgi:hypothetical protein
MSAFNFETHPCPFHNKRRNASGRIDSVTNKVLLRVHIAIIKKFFMYTVTDESHWSLCPVMVVVNSAGPLSNPVAREMLIHVLRRMLTNTSTNA